MGAVLWLSLALGGAGAAWTQEPGPSATPGFSGQTTLKKIEGTLIAFRGAVTVVRGGKEFRLQLRSLLREGDTVRTGAGSNATLLFSPGGLMVKLSHFTTVRIKNGGVTVVGGSVMIRNPFSWKTRPRISTPAANIVVSG